MHGTWTDFVLLGGCGSCGPKALAVELGSLDLGLLADMFVSPGLEIWGTGRLCWTGLADTQPHQGLAAGCPECHYWSLRATRR